jgi:hypothetical protein
METNVHNKRLNECNYFLVAFTYPYQTNVEEEGVPMVRAACLVTADAHGEVDNLGRKATKC